jgi:flagellar hook-associated protein 3 FlgL
MSGTLNNIHNSIGFALHLHSEAILKLQEQTTTGNRINRASDDPSDAYQVLGLKSQQRYLQNCVDTIAQSAGTLEVSMTALENMISAIGATKVDLTQIINGIYDEQGRERLAVAVNSTLEQMVSLANTRHMDEYVFGGGGTSSAPYVVERTAGEITKVTYQGSRDDRSVEIAPGLKSSALYVGDDLFRCDDRGTPVFVGGTGAGPGTGTSNICGDVWLTVTHDGSNYRLSIDDGATEVIVPAVGDVSNIAVTNASGQVLYVDATNINATGSDMVRAPGTHDIFSALISVRGILRNEQGLSNAELEQLRNLSIGSLEEVRQLLVGKSVSIGSRIGFLEDFKDSIERMKFHAEDEAAVVQQADIAQIAIDLSRREVLYSMSLSVAGKLMSLSLLDFID